MRVYGKEAPPRPSVRPFQCAHALVFRAFTVSVYMFLRQFCKRHWQSTSELVGLRRQVGAESVRSMHVHNFLSASRASTSGLFVSRCVTHTFACVQVASVLYLSAGVFFLVCGLRPAPLKRIQTVIRSTKRPPRANLFQMWWRCRRIQV